MAVKKELRTKVIKTEVIDCKQCKHSHWVPGDDKWCLFCELIQMYITPKGQKHPIPEEDCKLDNAE